MRWSPITQDGERAIDVVICQSIKEAKDSVLSSNGSNASNIEDHIREVNSHMKLWRRMGQNVLSTSMSSDWLQPCITNMSSAATESASTLKQRMSIGATTRSFLSQSFNKTKDPLLTTKKSMKSSEIKSCKSSDSASNMIITSFNGSKCDVILNLFDVVETWIRSGKYGNIRVGESVDESNASGFQVFGNQSEHNVDMMFESMSFNQKLEHVLDAMYEKEIGDGDPFAGMRINSTVCMPSVLSACDSIKYAFLNGVACMNRMGFVSYLVSKHTTNKCAFCDNTVHVLESCLFSPNGGECVTCGRHLCRACCKSHMHKRYRMCKACSLGHNDVVKTVDMYSFQYKVTGESSNNNKNKRSRTKTHSTR